MNKKVKEPKITKELGLKKTDTKMVALKFKQLTLWNHRLLTLEAQKECVLTKNL